MTKKLPETEIDKFLEELIRREKEYELVATVDLYRRKRDGDFRIEIFGNPFNFPLNHEEIEALTKVCHTLIMIYKLNQGGCNDSDRKQGQNKEQSESQNH